MGNTVAHEFLVELFRRNLDLAAILLRRYLGVHIPDYAVAVLGSEDATDVTGTAGKPKVKKSDAVVIYLHADIAKPPVWAVIIEVQRGQDKGKCFSWPIYHAQIRARHTCPTTLLVLCPDDATAKWARRPIDTGQPGYPWAPLVTTPRELLIDVTDTSTEAEEVILVLLGYPEKLVLDDPELTNAIIRVFKDMEENLGLTYIDNIHDCLPTTPAKQAWSELLMTTANEYKSDWALGYFNKGKAEGRVEGEADMMLMILEQRGVHVSPEARERIISCTDAEQLKSWGRRALSTATLTDADQLFD